MSACRFGLDPKAGRGSAAAAVARGLAALAPAAAASARSESDAENDGARSRPLPLVPFPPPLPRSALVDAGRIRMEPPEADAVERATSTGRTWKETAEGSARAESRRRLWLRTSSEARLTSRA